MVASLGFWGTKGSVWLERVLWRRISMEAVVSSQPSAVSSLLGCQNKRRLYPRVEGKQTARTESRGSVSGYRPIRRLQNAYRFAINYNFAHSALASFRMECR